MKTSKKIRLSDLGTDKKMDPEKLSELKGGADIVLLAGCATGVCTNEYKDEKDDACAKTDMCRSGAGPKTPTTHPSDGEIQCIVYKN